MEPAIAESVRDTYREQTKRYVYLLFALQAIGASSPPIIISLGGLVGEALSSNKALSTLPVSLYNIGLALSVLPVGALGCVLQLHASAAGGHLRAFLRCSPFLFSSQPIITAY
ncbi:hypothetical protein [Serratia aquatilis]|uniref:Uncharacterized protein n=1 Tax=Serratia aquatilis TaxID=1737515 RepID=A0ABV6EIK0_9GAMM